MTITLHATVDGTADIRPDDYIELKITGKSGDVYNAIIVRQTGVRDTPPDLGVSVSETMRTNDRVG